MWNVSVSTAHAAGVNPSVQNDKLIVPTCISYSTLKLTSQWPSKKFSSKTDNLGLEHWNAYHAGVDADSRVVGAWVNRFHKWSVAITDQCGYNTLFGTAPRWYCLFSVIHGYTVLWLFYFPAWSQSTIFQLSLTVWATGVVVFDMHHLLINASCRPCSQADTWPRLSIKT